MIEYNDLYRTWLVYKKGKKHSIHIDNFQYNIEDNLQKILEDIVGFKYSHGQYKNIVINEKKRRDLAVADVRDRIVHRFLYDKLVVVYDKTFDYDVWSCRKNKGLHKCIDRVRNLLCKYPDSYVWRSDITKFFDNVDHAILVRCLLQKLNSNSTEFWLCKQIISSYSSNKESPVGIPIGNLTSQIFSNIYLNEFDRFVRSELRPQAYVRYGDDFILVYPNYIKTRDEAKKGSDFLDTLLKLCVNTANNVIVPSGSGLHFLGHVITSQNAIVDRHTTQNVLSRLNNRNASSYKALYLDSAAKKYIDWKLVEELDKIFD